MRCLGLEVSMAQQESGFARDGYLHQSPGMGSHRGKFRPPRQAGGCASKISSPGAKVIHGCLLRVQMCRVGRSQDVSSRLPARTRTTPSRGKPEIQEPHSGHTSRVLTRPLSATRCRGLGSTPLRRKAVSATTSPIEKALLVKRWQAVQWHV